MLRLRAVRGLLALLILIGAVQLNGCALRGLKTDLAEYETTFGLGGRLQASSLQEDSFVAVLYKEENAAMRIFDYALPDPVGNYFFLVPEGVYFLSVFKDSNKNFKYDNGESYGYANQSRPIAIDAGQMAKAGLKSIKTMDVELTRNTGYRDDLPTYVDKKIFSGKSWMKVGVVTSLEDPLFVQENGNMGYWKPLAFLRDIGVGVYFLEAYDPARIPVLFVHGATGTPTGWKPLIDQLDKQKYQAWVFYYPSGFRLDAIASALHQIVQSLQERLKFKQMVVVAHSMGGLVSRSFILKSMAEAKPTPIERFISISTPWGGVNTAEKGAKKAPVVVPNWYDVAPNSEFIQSIYAQSLSERVRFYLFFGVRGDCSMMMANNDGTIEIASELDYRAQKDAVRIFGFDEDHGTILDSPEVLDQFRRLLN